MNRHKNIVLLLLIILFTTTCKEKYVPQLNEAVTGFLVVGGYINSGAGATTIYLSRSSKTTDKDTVIHETKASVLIQDKINTTSFVLAETSAGVYTYPQLTLNPSDQYRVYIKTSNGNIYVSDYSNYRNTPDIDSITWARAVDGIHVYGNAHDNTAVGYYQFKTEETWEFFSEYASELKFVYTSRGDIIRAGYRDSVNFGIDSSIYKCWKSNNPTEILITSTEKFTKNVVSQFNVITIPPADVRLESLYSVNLKMYSVSRENYLFLEQLKKNTEKLGSIFDAQPSDNIGNIHSLSNPAERVIGFVEISQEKTKRIFISNAQVPNWGYQFICGPLENLPNNVDSLRPVSGEIPTRPDPGHVPDSPIRRLYIAPVACVDCTTRGVNKKPAFWP